MVLVREWRAEDRHDTVAHDLIDGAFVAVDGFHHALEHRIEQLAGVLGIAVREQLERALDVGEEHRDLLALALQRAAVAQDLFGEVSRRVALGRVELDRCDFTAERSAALAAELLPGWIWRPAGGASPRKACSPRPPKISAPSGVLLAARAPCDPSLREHWAKSIWK